jgi:type I restriction enzyme, S subunit
MKGWKEKYFNDFIKLNRGFDLPNTNLIDGEFPVVTSTEIKSFHNEFKVEGPGVVTGRSGSLGTVQYVEGKYWPHNTTLYVKDFKGNHPKFVYYFLQIMHLENFNTGAGVPSLNQNHLHKQKIIIPKFFIQEQIASTLSAYDDLIETNNQRIKLLEQTARELYKEWFVRMRFPDFKKTKFKKGIPEGWEVVYFRDFIKLNRGFDLSDEKIIEGEYPVVASTSIKAYHKYYKVEAPCVSTGRSGSLGIVQYINQKSWPLNTSLYVKDFKGNSPRFVFYFLQGLNLENFNVGAGVPSLNQNHLHGLKFQLPPKKLQNKFDNFIIPVFEQIENLQQQNTQLRQIRDRLLPRLISGKLQVKETAIKKKVVI